MTRTQRLAGYLFRHFEKHGWPSWAKKWAPHLLGMWMGSKGEKR